MLIAVRGETESTVAALLGAAKGVTVARRCADLGEALAAAHAGRGAVVVVSAQPQLTIAVVAEFAASGVATVAVATTPQEVAQLRSLGVAEVLEAVGIDGGFAEDALGGLAELVMSAARNLPTVATEDARPTTQRATPSKGAIIAVWGPAGAPGRTTVAVTMAWELARRWPTILVDADTYGAAVAQALGLLDEAPGIAALARAALGGTLGAETVSRHAIEAAPGLRVLSGMTRAERWPELPAAALDSVWEVLRDHASFIVVDCGFCLERDEELQYDTRAPQRNGATLSALAAADAVVAVGSAEPLGIQRLVHALADLDRIVPQERTARLVVVNRVRASVAGGRAREAVADALKRYAGVDTVWTIGWDPRGCDAATLAGQSLGERAARSPVRKAIQAIAFAAADVASAAVVAARGASAGVSAARSNRASPVRASNAVGAG